MRTEAQKRAQNKYGREKIKQINLKFFPKEMDTYAKAKELGPSGIKKLIEKS